jgi:hypothetical protein
VRADDESRVLRIPASQENPFRNGSFPVRPSGGRDVLRRYFFLGRSSFSGAPFCGLFFSFVGWFSVAGKENESEGWEEKSHES